MHKAGRVVVVLLALAALPAAAEKADRTQVLLMSAKQGSAQGSKESNVKMLEGDVVIAQGTMRITAERAVVKETASGVVAELFGTAASQIMFRQKPDGERDYVEASADRAEYDDRSGAIRLFSKARFKSAGGTVDSDYMQYNTSTEKLELRGQAPGAKPGSGTSDGRVVFEVQPRIQDEKTGRLKAR